MNFPHLSGETQEFIALSDAKAIVQNKTIPLHSHVLARASRVFGQFFHHLKEGSAGPNGDTQADVSALFNEENLDTVCVTLKLLYSPDRTTVDAIMWRGECCDIDVSPQCLQAVMRLADKLDARDLLLQLDAAFDTVAVYGISDPLGWWMVGRQLQLDAVTSKSFKTIVCELIGVPCMSNQPAGDIYSTAAVALQDDKWTELPPSDFQMFMDAMSACSVGRPAGDAGKEWVRLKLEWICVRLKEWKGMGDFSTDSNVAEPTTANPSLAEVEALNQEQVQIDFGDEWEM